ncbi:putative mitochondrial carrier [Porphyridium purpureum]|uniref:Putative mitochondrial carrier n=1 Tax=Porphyridium purpureum TaxID=35688 RepID=A0A5J4Z3P8_PORPP|nr:putative mitochondrial carrier [Porphyridium purpureum]|eukprot:POR4769..scf295_1
MGGAGGDSKRSSGSAGPRVAGSTVAGVVELFGFHPIDTIAKRLMNNPNKILSKADLNGVLFKSAADKPALQKWMSLFPGLGFAAGYKILQRVYKFGGQPFVNDYLNGDWKGWFVSTFGEKHAKSMMHAVSGSLVGAGEIILLPLDVLKIKSQANPEVLRGRGIVEILRTEKISGLYRGAGWTAARNVPGSFALFGASALVKDQVFAIQDYRDATFAQNFVASIAGGVASIAISSPLDVVKTRIQTRDFSSTETGWSIMKEMVKKEGFGAFFKGLVPKLLVVGPKLIFSFTIAQQSIAYFEKRFATEATA